MDVTVVGQHALFFDDDSAAAFINSGKALVEWNSLLIDRYDVRHLLSAPPPRRKRRPLSLSPSSDIEAVELDIERYLDLKPEENEQESDAGANSVELGGYHLVAFSYGNAADNIDQKSSTNGMGYSEFQPPFPIPESLLHCLIKSSCALRLPLTGTLFPFDVTTKGSQPPTEKVHQIIARTALFVCKNGGQSEIVLRVKQGDNPTFAFLMPNDHLHPYFRYLIDHRDLLKSDLVTKSESKDQSVKANGALSLLGSIYGSGDDEDTTIKSISEPKENESGNTVDASVLSIGNGSQETGILAKGNETNEALSKHLSPEKENIQLLKKNTLMKVSKAGIPTGKKKEFHSSLPKITVDKSSSSALVTASNVEPVIVEPPSDIKKLVDRVVEFILKNGPQFEAVLIEQDNKYGRFPFLLRSNLFNSYYVNVLRKAHESKLPGMSKLEKKSSLGKLSDSKSLGPASGEIPNDYERKEKFKMVLGKPKKDGDEPPSTVTPSYAIDAAQTAAILQAATRGVKSSHFVPNISLNGDIRKENEGEAQMTEEQKVKAERLKRAKMFVSMLKSGAAPLKSQTHRSLSMEHLVSGKGRETSVTNDESEKKLSDSEIQERISKRKYRSKSCRHDGDEESDASQDGKKGNNEKHYGKKRESHWSSGRDGMEVDEEVKDEDNRHGKRKHRSHCSSSDNDLEEDEEVKDKRHGKRKHRSHRSSRDNDLEEEEVDDDDDRYYRHDKRKHRSRHSSYENDKEEEEEKEEGSKHIHSIRKHRSYRSSRVSDVEDEEDRDYRHGKRKHRSHRSSHKDESEKDGDGRDHKKSRKKHRSHYSSDEEVENDVDYEERHSKKKHRSRHSSRRSKSKHKRAEQPDEDQPNSSSEKLRSISQSVKDLEEGEISSKRPEKSREASIDASSSYRGGRAPSQLTEATEVPDDLRAKIRAMLMANF